MQRLDTRDPSFPAAWGRICARGSDEDEAPVREAAQRVVADVRARGDAALLEYTRRFDGWDPGTAASVTLGRDAMREAFEWLNSLAAFLELLDGIVKNDYDKSIKV